MERKSSFKIPYSEAEKRQSLRLRTDISNRGNKTAVAEFTPSAFSLSSSFYLSFSLSSSERTSFWYRGKHNQRAFVPGFASRQ